MKKTTLYFLYIVFALLLFNPAFSQEEEQEEKDYLYQLHQIEHTEDSVLSFFKKNNITFKTDSAYVFLLPPGGCPRCEGLINPTISYLRRLDTVTDIFLVAVKLKPSVAKKYLKENVFNYDAYFLDDGSFIKNFKTSSMDLSVPYVTKFYVTSGTLVNAQSLLGFQVDSTNVRNFSNRTEPLPKQAKVVAKEEVVKKRNTKSTKNWTIVKNIPLKEDDNYPVSNIGSMTVNSVGTELLINDHVSATFYSFDLTTGSFKSALQPTEEEKNMFLLAPEKTIQYLKSINLLRTMYLSAAYYTDSLVLISASLPKVFINDSVTGNITYSNNSTLLLKEAATNRLIKLVSFERPNNTEFSISHPNAQYDESSGLFFLPVSKGWPVAGTEMLNEQDSTENPFLTGFYKNTPSFAIYTKEGAFIKYFGKLNYMFEKLQMGYYASSPQIKSHNNKLYVVDFAPGVIYEYNDINSETPSDSIDVFKLNPVPATTINKEEQPLEHLNETYRINFKESVMDFAFTKKYGYVVAITDVETYVYVICLKSKKIKKKLTVPPYHNASKLKLVKLKSTDNNMHISSLYDDGMKVTYVEYNIR